MYSADTVTEKTEPQKAADRTIMTPSPHTEVFELKHSETAHTISALPAEKEQDFICINFQLKLNNDLPQQHSLPPGTPGSSKARPIQRL